MLHTIESVNTGEINKLCEFLESLTCGEMIARRVRLDMLADPSTAKLKKGMTTQHCPSHGQTGSPSQRPALRLVGAEDTPEPR